MNFRIAKKYPKKNGDSALLNHSSETKEKDHQLAELKWIEEQRKNAAEEARAAAEEVRKDRRLSLEEKAHTYLSDKLAFDIAVFNAKK
jgi:polynucleotide 5'-kinase involved in rRNA processing